MVDEKKETGELKTPILIDWHVPEGLMTPLATNMVVQTSDDYFKVSFFEIKPPIQLDKTLPPPTQIRADCVASVIIMPDKLPKFIEVLQRQYDKYVSKKQAG